MIKDNNDNEWVWVPVDEETYSSMFAENIEGIALLGDTGVKTTKYSTSASLIGQTQSLPGSTSGYHEPDIVPEKGTEYDYANYSTAGFSSLNDMATKLVDEYNTMLDSIKKYSGFYIGRYELSSSGVKANQSPTTNTDWYNLYKQCKELTIDETKGMTRMIWGCQWDATCKYISEKGDKVSLSSSSSYGNYGSGSVADTGVTAKTRTNNIYDLARKCMRVDTRSKQHGLPRLSRW